MIFEESEKSGVVKKKKSPALLKYMKVGIMFCRFQMKLRNAAILTSLSSSISLPTTYLKGELLDIVPRS